MNLAQGLGEAVQLSEDLQVRQLYGWDDRSFALYLFVVGLLIAFVLSWGKRPGSMFITIGLIVGTILGPLLLMKLRPVRQIVIPLFRWLVQ